MGSLHHSPAIWRRLGKPYETGISAGYRWYPDAEQIRNQETDLSLQRRTRSIDQRAASGRLHPERRSVIQPSIGSRTRFRPIHRPHTGSGWSRLLR